MNAGIRSTPAMSH